MSVILRWFHDGDIRYRAYFRTTDDAPSVRQLVVASRDGEAADVAPDDRRLDDYSSDELLACARRLRDGVEHAEMDVLDAAGD